MSEHINFTGGSTKIRIVLLKLTSVPYEFIPSLFFAHREHCAATSFRCCARRGMFNNAQRASETRPPREYRHILLSSALGRGGPCHPTALREHLLPIPHRHACVLPDREGPR